MRLRTSLVPVVALVLAACSSGRPATPTTSTTPQHSATPSHATSATAATPPTHSTAPTHTTTPSHSATRPVTTVPQFDHIVVVVLENHSAGDLVGNAAAPFLQSLIQRGTLLTRSYAVTHPSEPNYLALFSGSTQGVADDSCPHSFATQNLATALAQHHRTFTGYSEDLPSTGYLGCSYGSYARKHNPWSDFPAVPASANKPMTAFPLHLTQLPDVAFVVPNLVHDMHDGSVAEADAWLHAQLGAYATWAPNHHSLLIVTTDEDDYTESNRILTVLVGAGVRHGATDDERLDHYGVLRTVLASFGIPPFAHAVGAHTIAHAWR